MLPALAPGHARAAEVIVVDGSRALRVEDPLMPPRSESDLGPAPGSRAAVARAAATSSKRGRRAVRRALRGAIRSRRLARRDYARFAGAYVGALKVQKRLRGARRAQLRYVISSLEGMAIRRALIPSRMPAAFVQLERNVRYWRALPFPRGGDRVTFPGSEIVYQYYPGRGLQLQPLTTFKKANLIHGACERGLACRRSALRRLLDEMNRLAVNRGRGMLAWEYLFHFGGGSPPWISGLSQGTAVQALGRAGRLLDHHAYFAVAGRALRAFETGPPVGVRGRGPGGGIHYLEYSFAPRLFIFNGFLQALIGLYDYAQATGDGRANGLFREAEPEGRREAPMSDLGDWSRYSFRGRESTAEYHELLREFLQSLCNRLRTPVYCTHARRFRSYQVDPAELTYGGPGVAGAREDTPVFFDLSKLAAVEITVVKNGESVFNKVATFRRGRRSFTWKPRSAGTYDVHLGAKELRTGRGLKTRTSGTVEVR
jgi:hypothetical protein